jgi:hypothetical protein
LLLFNEEFVAIYEEFVAISPRKALPCLKFRGIKGLKVKRRNGARARVRSRAKNHNLLVAKFLYQAIASPWPWPLPSYDINRLFVVINRLFVVISPRKALVSNKFEGLKGLKG